MMDRIRRHLYFAQCILFIKKNPEICVLTIEALKTTVQNSEIESVIGRMYTYSNVVGSYAYRSKKRIELEAIIQQKGFLYF